MAMTAIPVRRVVRADAFWAAVVEKILMMSIVTRITPGHPD